MYLYMGLLAVIPGIIYFTFFINRLLRTILNIHTNWFLIIIIGLVIMVLSIPAMNTLELYGVIYYHLLAVMLLFELLNLGLKRFPIYRISFTTGILGIVVTALFLGYGYYNIKHVVATTYDLKSDKVEDLKILEIADLHMSTSLSVTELQKYCDEMSQLNADLVVLTGDIFDENTPLDDMVNASKALASINNQQGIYYVYGNHDNGSHAFSDSEFGPEDVRATLEKNGIVVLEDAVVLEMIPENKRGNYTIMLDHQPLNLDENAALGIDLQLSGHTHGGQLFPMGIVQSLTSDTLIRGQRDIGDFTAITTTGIAGWRYPIKTGAPSEYVIINIK